MTAALDELRGVVGLAEMATEGVFEAEWVVDEWRVKSAGQPRNVALGMDDVDSEFIVAAVNWTRTHAPALIAEVERLRAEVAEARRVNLLADTEETAVWNYLQRVSPWSESNDMLWSDEIITGIDLLIQRATEAEAELAEYVKSAQLLAVERAEFRIRAERAESAGRRVVAAFEAHGKANGVTVSLTTRQECERAMTALADALRASGSGGGEGGGA